MTILNFSTEMWLYVYGYIPLSPRNLSLMYYHLGCAQALLSLKPCIFFRAHTLTLSLLSSKCAHTHSGHGVRTSTQKCSSVV